MRRSCRQLACDERCRIRILLFRGIPISETAHNRSTLKAPTMVISRLARTLHDPLCTLHDAHYWTTCNTCFRLTGWSLPEGSRLLWVAMNGFQSLIHNPFHHSRNCTWRYESRYIRIIFRSYKGSQAETLSARSVRPDKINNNRELEKVRKNQERTANCEISPTSVNSPRCCV